jgi:hypothetical protein
MPAGSWGGGGSDVLLPPTSYLLLLALLGQTASAHPVPIPHPLAPTRRLAPNNPLQGATETSSAGMPGNQRRDPLGKRFGFPPAYGSTARGRRSRRLTRCFLLLLT